MIEILTCELIIMEGDDPQEPPAGGFRNQGLRLAVIGIFAALALIVTLIAFFYGGVIFGVENIVLLPHLYLIPIIFFAFWYPKRGLQITVVIIITITILTLAFTLGGLIRDPLFMLLVSGVDLMIVFALVLYAKDRDLVDSLLKEIVAQYKLPREGTISSERFNGDVSEVLKALRSGDDDDREEAARALGELRKPEGVDPLISALSDPSRYVRREAAKALGAIGDERSIPPLIQALSDDDRSVREGAAEGLALLGEPAVGHLTTALDDPDWHIRMGAVVALRIIGDRNVLPEMIRMTGDESRFVRREAVKTLGRMGGEEVVSPLAASLRDDDAGVRLRAAGALGRTGSSTAVGPLAGALEDRDSSVRLRAAQALEEMGTPAARAALGRAPGGTGGT